MAAVYSTLMFRAPSFSGSAVTVYTCPPDKVAVVKCMSIVWGDVSVSGLDAWIQTQDLTKLCRVTDAYTVPGFVGAGGTQVFWGEWVLYPGESLSCQTASGTVDFQASGYELSTP